MGGHVHIICITGYDDLKGKGACLYSGKEEGEEEAEREVV